MCRLDSDCDALNRLVLAGARKRVPIATPGGKSLKVSWSIDVKYRVGAKTHPCFTPSSTKKVICVPPLQDASLHPFVYNLDHSNDMTGASVFCRQLPKGASGVTFCRCWCANRLLSEEGVCGLSQHLCTRSGTLYGDDGSYTATRRCTTRGFCFSLASTRLKMKFNRLRI